MRQRIFILVMVLVANLAQASGPQKIDYLALSSTLVKDGYIQRAKSVLDKVDVLVDDFDFATYYTLKGLVFQKTGYPLVSNIFLDAAIEQGQSNPSIYFYKARNYWQRNEYDMLIAALDQAGEETLENPQMLVIKAEAFKQIKNMEAAWNTLDQGIDRHPQYAQFYSQKFYYLLELGYYQQAQEYARQYLKAQGYTANDYLALAYALRESGEYEQAAVLLEEGVIKYNDNDKLLELLGQVYVDQQQYMMAALVYEFASMQFPRFSAKASALYLKAESPVRALQLNRRILEQEEKFRQRIGIDIQLEDYESMVAKTEPLKRYDLLSDDNILYALGFAHFKNGNYPIATSYLQQINDSQLFTKATYLFKQIEICQNDPYACR
ncbi:hypothetical protein A3715_02095 [Oleiphilus sp. HI0009]|nr:MULTISPECIES: hypothetical protein [unclassified Oleiphilus]KZX76171.1 hypothetical protein A3715_02095 [Oleiphilus sp. HI0009]KZY63225.1 hypothetical protein A3738_12270 [Oleiphilus sp. HI0066]KZY67589.1 hypothetical protein A3739_12385 [Oleiphilus sp. HI0067]